MFFKTALKCSAKWYVLERKFSFRTLYHVSQNSANIRSKTFILDQPLRRFAIKNIQYFFAVQSLTPSGIFQAKKTKNRFSANVIFIENMISPFLGKKDFFQMNFRTTNSVFCEGHSKRNCVCAKHSGMVLFL
jgi:hypothetical protein